MKRPKGLRWNVIICIIFCFEYLAFALILLLDQSQNALVTIQIPQSKECRFDINPDQGTRSRIDFGHQLQCHMNWEEVGFQKLSKLKKNIFRGTLTLIINKRAMALKTCGDKDCTHLGEFLNCWWHRWCAPNFMLVKFHEKSIFLEHIFFGFLKTSALQSGFLKPRINFELKF